MDSKHSNFQFFSKLSLLLVLAIIVAARAVWLFISDPQRFPIHTVKIEASYQHLSHQQLQSVIEPYVQNSFFTIPISRMAQAFQSIDRIATVQVEREWPDKLIIYLREKVPYARWNQQLTTINGELFNCDDRDNQNMLPQLNGPEYALNEILSKYKILHNILSGYGLSASIVTLRENHAWELTLNDGVLVRLGKQDIEARTTRLAKSYNNLRSQSNTLPHSIDLRYSKGMAVEWSPE